MTTNGTVLLFGINECAVPYFLEFNIEGRGNNNGKEKYIV
jgi:hypothetical protein